MLLVLATSSQCRQVIPFVLTIGCHSGRPYVIDMHPVTQPLGNGNGLILVGKENSPDVWMSLCAWLWQRLHHGGVDPQTAQSSAVVTLETKCTWV